MLINPLHVIISNIFYFKILCFSEQIKWQKEWHCFTFLEISLMYGLLKCSWVLMSASLLNLLRHVVLVE